MSVDTLIEQVTTTNSTSLRGERLHGLAWVAWRQNRALVWVLLAAVAAVGCFLWFEHSAVVEATARVRQAGCGQGQGTATDTGESCWPLLEGVSARASDFTDRLQPLLAAVPLLIGMFVGVPLFSQEFERGTHRLLWSQSVSRTRWLAVRLGTAAALVLLATAALAGLASWFWHTDVHTELGAFDPPFQGLTYVVLGVVPVATALFGLTVGVLVGLLMRRTLPAIGVTAVLLPVLELGMFLLRPSLYPQVYGVQQISPNFDGFMQPTDAWLVSHGMILADGSKVANDGSCINQPGCRQVSEVYGYYHPVSHFWPIQLIESGVLLALAAAIVAFVFHRVRRVA
ncbi:ABC transporter permease subunit [Kitasatospora mediocidica]|uniref:ABC transporter permease subunit n=1 Tax=Kitasatospora mediocidica TaxID=58352 RepID=UPI0006911CDF|nr:ABC transporter permease subunit [Kitasatospora mediocidica]